MAALTRCFGTGKYIINRKKKELFNHVSSKQYLINRKRRNNLTTYHQDNILLTEKRRIYSTTYLNKAIGILLTEKDGII
jgi:hypothetical protein